MSIYTFKPTFLYIKRHTKTGLLYFGKTIKPDVESYVGSGVRWLRHLDKHGKEHVETLWYCLFLTEQDCTNFALSFSSINEITDSNSWANLMPENGIGGGPVFNTHFKIYNKLPKTLKTRTKISQSILGKTYKKTEETKTKISNSLKGKKCIYGFSCIIHGTTYKSIKAARLSLNLTKSQFEVLESKGIAVVNRL